MKETKATSKSKKENHPRPGIARLLMAATALAAAFAVTYIGMSNNNLLDIGKNLALLSVGIMQPEGSIIALSEKLERIPSKGSGSRIINPATPALSYSLGGGFHTSGILNSSPAARPDKIPKEAGNGGKVIEQQMATGSTFIQGVAIKNASSRTVDIAAELKNTPRLTINNTFDPQVLIYHTHTTEAYMTYYAGYYNADDAERMSFHSRASRTTSPASSRSTIPCCCPPTPIARTSSRPPAAEIASRRADSQAAGGADVPSGCAARPSRTRAPVTASRTTTLQDCVEVSTPATRSAIDQTVPSRCSIASWSSCT